MVMSGVHGCSGVDDGDGNDSDCRVMTHGIAIILIRMVVKINAAMTV